MMTCIRLDLLQLGREQFLKELSKVCTTHGTRCKELTLLLHLVKELITLSHYSLSFCGHKSGSMIKSKLRIVIPITESSSESISTHNAHARKLTAQSATVATVAKEA